MSQKVTAAHVGEQASIFSPQGAAHRRATDSRSTCLSSCSAPSAVALRIVVIWNVDLLGRDQFFCPFSSARPQEHRFAGEYQSQVIQSASHVAYCIHRKIKARPGHMAVRFKTRYCTVVREPHTKRHDVSVNEAPQWKVPVLT